MYKAGFYLKISILCLLIAGIVLLCGCLHTVATVYPDDRLMWDHINRSEPAVELPEIPGGAIIPHHTITANTVARFYKGLSRKIDPEVIFLLSPNHFETGGHSVITGKNLKFDTVYGTLETENTIIRKLVQDGLALVHNDTFSNEHGIFFHAPFIKKYFPRAKVVPILLEWKNSMEENDRIAEFISGYLDKGGKGAGGQKESFVIASVDFSHYQPRAVADFHDETSYFGIKNFNYKKLYDLEVDSPSSLYVLLKSMEKRGYKRGERFLHTNSDDYLNKNEKQTTSHQYFAFFKGEIEKEPGITLLFSGAIDLTNDTLYRRLNWDWDRNYDFEKDVSIEKYLKNLRGEEDRFFTGADVYLFDLKEINEADILTFGEERMALIKFDDFSKSYSEQVKIVQNLKRKNSYVVILYHCKDSKFSTEVQGKFRGLVDAGGDVIIGKGIRNIKKEIYNGKPVFYSAGDFITGRQSAGGELIGLVLRKEGIHFYTFPVKLENRYPAYEGVFD